jgi:hypothetical protein
MMPTVLAPADIRALTACDAAHTPGRAERRQEHLPDSFHADRRNSTAETDSDDEEPETVPVRDGRVAVRVLSRPLVFAVVVVEAMMARRGSLWSDLQRERDRRERAARARERAQEQLVRQFTQQRERAVRQAAREDAAERKRQELLAHEAGASAARAMREQLDSRLTELRSVLMSGLSAPPTLTFVMLRRTAECPAFDPGELGRPLVAPDWAAFAPPPPGALSGLVRGKN